MKQRNTNYEKIDEYNNNKKKTQVEANFLSVGPTYIQKFT